MHLCPKSVVKLILWIYTQKLKSTRLQVGKSLSYFKIYVVAVTMQLQAIRVVEDQFFLLTYICPNHLKLHVDVSKSFYTKFLHWIVIVFAVAVVRWAQSWQSQMGNNM